MKQKAMVSLLLTQLWAITLFAQEEFEEIFFKEIIVEAPTKKAEKAEEVPAFLTVARREDIFNYGFLDINRILSFQTGVEVVESFYGYSEVVIRGIYPTHYNNKSLFLIDQYPLYEPVNGSFHIEFFPLGSLERIEIVRGPGSSIYGTNAFTGIINIIPRSGKDINGFDVDILSGAHGREFLTRALLTYGKDKGGIDYLLSGELFLDGGYRFEALDEGIPNKKDPESRKINYKNNYGNFLMKIKSEHFRVIFGYFNQEKMKFGIIPLWMTHGESTYEGFYGEGSISGNLSEKFHLTFRAGYNNLQRVSHLGALSGYTYPSFPTTTTSPRVEMTSGGDVVRAELTGEFRFNESLSLLSGMVYERQHTNPYIFIDRDRLELHSKYAFLTSRWKNNLGVYLEGRYLHRLFNIYAGGRGDYDSRRKAMRFTPRAGVVVKPLKDTSVKIIYSEAFRYPNFFEYDVQTANVLIGNPELKEEFIRSIDAGLEGILFKKIRYSLVGYFEDIHNTITREPSPRVNIYPQEFWYVNRGGIEVWGVELTLEAKPLRIIEITGNFTFRDGELEYGVSGEIPYLSKYLANVGVRFILPFNLEIIPTYQYIGRKEKVDASLPDNSTRSYNLFNTTIAYRWKELTVRGIVLNITGENLKYPDHIRGKVFIPGENEISFFGEVSYKF